MEERTGYIQPRHQATDMKETIFYFLFLLRLMDQLFRSRRIQEAGLVFSMRLIFRWRPIRSTAMSFMKFCSPMASRELSNGPPNTRGECASRKHMPVQSLSAANFTFWNIQTVASHFFQKR